VYPWGKSRVVRAALNDIQRHPTLVVIGLLALLILLPMGLEAVIGQAPRPFSPSPESVGSLKRPASSISPSAWPLLLALSIAMLGLSLTLAIRMKSKTVTGNPRLLTLLCALSLLTYALHFLLPYPLHTYYSLQRVSMGWIARRHPLAALSTAIALINLFFLFYLSYRTIGTQRSRSLWVVLILGGLLLAAVNACTFNITSTDIYDYVARGRITAIYEANPYLSVPNDFPGDALIQLAAWRNSPSAYGPLWELLSGTISAFFGSWLWGNVIAYKVVAFLAYLGGTLFIALLLRRSAPERVLQGTLFFAWNPLILLEGLANGHNDVLMIGLLLAGVWVLHLATQSTRECSRFLFTALALTLLLMSVLIKFVPILLLPIFLLAALKREPTWRRKITSGILALVPAVVLLVLSYLGFWSWPEILSTFTGRLALFRMSFASAVLEILQVWIDPDFTQWMVTLSFVATFVLGYFIIIVRTAFALGQISPSGSILSRSSALRRIFIPRTPTGSWPAFVRGSLLVLVLYIFVGSLWFWPWYLIWPIALFSLDGDWRWTTPVLLVCTAGQLSHVLWNFLWYWMGISWDTLYRVDILVVASLLLPALGVILWRRRLDVPY
jgi:hypothetical protein